MHSSIPAPPKKPTSKTPAQKNKKTFFPALLLLGAGILLGIAAKLFDLYTTNLGNLFSQTSIWIFLCTLISLYSRTAGRAAVHVFCFCIGMLFSYYMTAELTGSVYSLLFAYGWTLFSFLSPVMGILVWYTRGRGVLAKMLSAGILFTMLAAAVVLFDKIRLSDMILVAFTGVFLLKRSNTLP